MEINLHMVFFMWKIREMNKFYFQDMTNISGFWGVVIDGRSPQPTGHDISRVFKSPMGVNLTGQEKDGRCFMTRDERLLPGSLHYD